MSDLKNLSWFDIDGIYNDLNKYFKLYNKADQIVKSIIKPGMSELEKEKAVHDYIVLNTKYDYDNY